MFMFILVLVLWGSSGISYWAFRAVKYRRYNAYAAGRLDTLYVVFMGLTVGLLVSASIMVWG